MYHSPIYTKRVAQLRQFLILLADKIVQQPNVQSKSFKLRVNYIPAYTFVYQLCNEKPSLQQKMLQEFKHSLSYLVQAYVTQQSRKNPFDFKLENSSKAIQWYICLWEKFIKFMIVISKKVFSYLDRYYMTGQDEGNLYQAGLALFKKNVLHQGNAKYFVNCYFKQLRQIRQTKIIQNHNLRRMSQSLAIIDKTHLYQDFVKRYFQQSQSYWNSFFSINSATLTSFQYYGKIYNMYLFETNLLEMSCLMSLIQASDLFQLFGSILVSKYTDTFVASSNQNGLRSMFDKKNVDYMVVVNQVYQRFEGFQKIRQAYYDYLLSQGDKLLIKNQSPKNQHTYQLVDLVYNFYKHHMALLSNGFKKRNQLLVTLNNAIQKIISKHDTFTSQLYNYCSQIRNKNIFNLTENKQKLTSMLGKISNKDQFISLYQNQLLNKMFNSQISIENQEIFANYLNEMYENQLTHKLIKKINDFKQAPKKEEIVVGLPSNISFNINILSLHLWEKKFNDQITLNMNLPNNLQILWRTIQRNFTQKQPKKKLLVLPFENKLIIEVKFNHKACLIKCNLIQASILIYLSQKAYASQEQIILNLMVQKNVLQNIIQTLQSIPNLIIKTALGDYLINWNFDTSQPLLDLASKIQQSKQMTKAIKQDRQILLQAAIVKFIKKAKQSMFQQITQGVHKTIKLFKPQPSNIKLAVQKLIKKGYIEEKQNGVLEYVE